MPPLYLERHLRQSPLTLTQRCSVGAAHILQGALFTSLFHYDATASLALAQTVSRQML